MSNRRPSLTSTFNAESTEANNPYDFKHPTVVYAKGKYGVDPYALFHLMNKQIKEFIKQIGKQ